MRVAQIEDGQIVNVILAPDDWEAPGDGTAMTEEAALAAGIPHRMPDVVTPDAATLREQVFESVIAAGHCVAEGYCLGMTELDRTNWSQKLAMLAAGEAVGYVNGETPIEFRDVTGAWHTATLTRFRQMMFTLGLAYVEADKARNPSPS
jgi:hypothetical protein